MNWGKEHTIAVVHVSLLFLSSALRCDTTAANSDYEWLFRPKCSLPVAAYFLKDDHKRVFNRYFFGHVCRVVR